MNGTSNPFKVMLSKAADGVTQKIALVATAVALGTAAVLLVQVWIVNNLGEGISERESRRGNLGEGISERESRRGNLGEGISERESRRGNLGEGISERKSRRGNLGEGILETVLSFFFLIWMVSKLHNRLQIACTPYRFFSTKSFPLCEGSIFLLHFCSSRTRKRIFPLTKTICLFLLMNAKIYMYRD